MTEAKRYFFCGVGGSGMLPLALLARARGDAVWGSDRSRDQGRTPDKFAWLERQGIRLFPQDGSGLGDGAQILVASAAVEDDVPDVAAANRLGCARMTRAELNAQMFNAASHAVGIGGTSGKSTVTGMVGWILHALGKRPSVMNGAVMRNFADGNAPFASALIGDPALYVSEVDESDGSIALYDADIAIVTNVTLDHKSIEELNGLFGDFLARARVGIINADDPLSAGFSGDNLVRFGFGAAADVRGRDLMLDADGARFTVQHGDAHADVHLRQVGRHNAMNALAAIAAVTHLGVSLADAAAALSHFAGLARRYEIIGSTGGITLIDDFAHNPDKMAATLAAAGASPGRLLLFFQPHGYGPLRQMGTELAAAFASGMRDGDKLFVCDPAYFGGSVARDDGATRLVANVFRSGRWAAHMTHRDKCAEAMLAFARAGDRILILGARDDSLSDFARDILARLNQRTA